MITRDASAKVPLSWGVTSDERGREYPCDAYVNGPYESWYRGVDVASSADILFRWLCQLRVAPYSYDWIDNLGRRSPEQLIPGLDQLAVGQNVMFAFEIVAFESGRSITLLPRGARLRRVAGPLAMTYAIFEGPESTRCRLVGKIVLGGRVATAPAWVRRALCWGDLVMMRRQLRRLAALAHRDLVAGSASAHDER